MNVSGKPYDTHAPGTSGQGTGPTAHITHLLGMIGVCLEVPHICIFENDARGGVTRITHEWRAEGAAPADAPPVPLDALSDWQADLCTTGMAAAGNTAALPAPLCTVLAGRGICSVAVFPLYHNEVMFGFVCFGTCTHYRDWSTEDAAALRAMANLAATSIVRHHCKHKAAASQQMLCAALNNIATPIYITDPEGSRLLFANRMFQEYFPCTDTRNALCWQTGQDGPCLHCPRDRLRAMPRDSVCTWENEHAPTGRRYACTGRLIEWMDGQPAHLHTVLDITARRACETPLMHRATCDGMTGIYDRDSGLALLDELLGACARDDMPVTFCYLDIDGLKYVNDTYGRGEGDRLLTTVVDVIRRAIRTGDVFARLGGDAFMLALRDCTADAADDLLAGVKERLAELTRSGGFSYALSFSEGLYEIAPGQHVDFDSILNSADQGPYRHMQS